MGLMNNPNAWCCIVISRKICLMRWLTSPCASFFISSLLRCLYVLHISLWCMCTKAAIRLLLLCSLQTPFWNARSVKVFLLQHNTPVPPGQFNDTVVKVPKSNWLCSRRGCGCQKQYLQTLHKIFSIYWLKKKRKAGTLCLHQCSQRTKILYCTIHQNHKWSSWLSLMTVKHRQ